MYRFFIQVGIRKILLFLTDTAITIFTCFFIAILMPSAVMTVSVSNVYYCLLMLGCLSAVRLVFRTYNSIWRFADVREYLFQIGADAMGCIVCAFACHFLFAGITFIYVAATFMLSLLLVLLSRIMYRQLSNYMRVQSQKKADHHNGKRYIAIVGAGYAGTMLLEELTCNERSAFEPYCFFDQDQSKVGNSIHGVKVRGMGEMPQVLQDSPINEVIIAIPSISVSEKQNIINICAQAGCKAKVYGYPFDRIEHHDVQKLSIRDIRIEDLLCRDTVSFDREETAALIRGRRVLITGGGGSIGSELCRQVVAMSPREVVILDIYENSAHEIQQELLDFYGKALELTVEIASIRDAAKIDYIFAQHRPEIVFHAAAHKHVPLMESNCDEAVKNNVFGTLNVVNASEKCGVRKFILISSDKAVNPTNVMGATKRVCEMIIQSKYQSKTDFVAVRFGNVLGSNGSVIPLFSKQIAQGGPITVTDKRVTRYFMTIPEAVQLVMQAGAMAAKSEIYVLDMGHPVKILEMAENMIKLAGLSPYKDIDIVEVGLRPGEKLFEELLMNTETLDKTRNAKIFIEHEDDVEEMEIMAKLMALKLALKAQSMEVIRDTLKEVVPTYQSPAAVNDTVELEPRMAYHPEQREAVAVV